jgi:hypothetical protein
MNNLDVTVRRSSSASSIPSTPTIIVSESTMPFPTPEAAADLEERTRKDLELDRKDAELELHRYEDAGLLLDIAERTMDILRFWEVCEIFPLAASH